MTIMMLWTSRSFVGPLVSSAAAVVCSEVGDNTFFMAVILAMNNSRLAVFAGALTANVIMHALAVSVGYVKVFIPYDVVVALSTVILVFYGLKMLRDGYYMSPDKTEKEYREAEKDLEKHEKFKRNKTESGLFDLFMSSTLLKSFTLTLLCEWGDRSQISAVLMTTHGDVSAVLFGGILGHGFCLIMATVGGNYVGRMVSTRTMTLCGSLVFLLVALSSVLEHAVDDFD